METLFHSYHEPKRLELERTDDGRLRLVITLTKLNVVSKLEYFLETEEASSLSKALTEAAGA